MHALGRGCVQADRTSPFQFPAWEISKYKHGWTNHAYCATRVLRCQKCARVKADGGPSGIFFWQEAEACKVQIVASLLRVLGQATSKQLLKANANKVDHLAVLEAQVGIRRSIASAGPSFSYWLTARQRTLTET